MKNKNEELFISFLKKRNIHTLFASKIVHGFSLSKWMGYVNEKYWLNSAFLWGINYAFWESIHEDWLKEITTNKLKNEGS